MKLHTCPKCGKGCFYYEDQPYHKCLRCSHYHGIIAESAAKEEVKSDLEAQAIAIAAEMSILRGWVYLDMRVTDNWFCVLAKFWPLGVTVGIWNYAAWEQAKQQMYGAMNMVYNSEQRNQTYVKTERPRKKRKEEEAA